MLACARTRLVRCDANDVLCPGEALTVTATTGKAWPRSWPAVLAWALGVLTLLSLGATVWFDWLLGQAGRTDLTQLDAYVIPWLPAAAIAATVGAVVASRRPRHPVGVAAGGRGAVGGGRRCVRRVRALWATGPARSAAGRRLGGCLQPGHVLPDAGMHWLYPAADAERIAAVAPLALVGQGGGGQCGHVCAGADVRAGHALAL